MRRPLITTLIVLCAITTYSQRNYIVKKPGDTLDVQFVVPPGQQLSYGDSVWLQDQIVVMDNGKPVTIVPDEIHGYYYKGVYREALVWTKDMTTHPWTFEKKFCERIASGAIDVYRRHDVKPSFRDPSEMITVTTMWYRDNKKDPINAFAAGWLNFNKGVSKLVSDYPELSARVKNGEFSSKEFLKVAQEYNTWAASNKKQGKN